MIVHHLPEPRNPSRVVVIGARGFIGAALLRQFGSVGVPVLGLSSTDIDLCSDGAGERLAARLKADDTVLMLAALTPDKGRGVATMIRNLAMMEQFCAALAKAGCAHLVYFSSDAVYGLGPARVTEETSAAPQDLYGTMHLARELMAREVKAPVLVLRPTLVYGAGDTHNAYGPNRFRRSAVADGRITLFGGGEETRDHVYVDDVAALALRAVRSRSAGVLNVATGVSTTFRRVAELVASAATRPVEIVTTPRAVPVTHRHYDITNLLKAFADFRFRGLGDGIAGVRE